MSTKLIKPDHVHMMTHPDLWPNWPVLPLKHSTRRDTKGFPEVAYLVEVVPWGEMPAPDKLDIRLVNQSLYQVRDKVLSDYPQADAAALVADGWVVD